MIRPATTADAAAIAEINVEAWCAAYASLLPADYLAQLSVQQRAQFWHQELSAGRVRVLVAEEGGRLHGWISGGVCRDANSHEHFEIYAIYVAPANWRTGVGRRLVKAMEEQFQASKDVVLWVLAGNDQAISFYRTLGYAPDGVEKSIHIGGAALIERRFRKCRSKNAYLKDSDSALKAKQLPG